MIVYAFIFSFGLLFGEALCSARRFKEADAIYSIAKEVTKSGEQCMATLDGVTRAAIVLARGERGRLWQQVSVPKQPAQLQGP